MEPYVILNGLSEGLVTQEEFDFLKQLEPDLIPPEPDLTTEPAKLF